MKTKLLKRSQIALKELYFWIDYKTILCYIRNKNGGASVFAIHRINKIRNNSEIQD